MKKTVFWDLDRVLLRTDALLQWILEDLGRAVGWQPEQIAVAIVEVDKTGFEWCKLLEHVGLPREQCDVKEKLYFDHYETRTCDFVAPGVLAVVTQLAERGMKQSLVTFGQEKFQREKWNRLTPFHPYITTQSYVRPGETKGERIAELLTEDDASEAFFVDDSTEMLRSALLHSPRVRRIRATWIVEHIPHPGDDVYWFVACTPEQALAQILAV